MNELLLGCGAKLTCQAAKAGIQAALLFHLPFLCAGKWTCH